MAGRKEVILRGEAPAWAAEARAGGVEEDRMAVVAGIDQQSPILLGEDSKIKIWRNVICA